MGFQLRTIFDKDLGINIFDLLADGQTLVPSVLMRAIIPDLESAERVNGFDRWCHANGGRVIPRSMIGRGLNEVYNSITPDQGIKYVLYVEMPKSQASRFEEQVRLEFPAITLSVKKEWTWVRSPEGNGSAYVELSEFLKEKSRNKPAAPSV